MKTSLRFFLFKFSPNPSLTCSQDRSPILKKRKKVKKKEIMLNKNKKRD